MGGLVLHGSKLTIIMFKPQRVKPTTDTPENARDILNIFRGWSAFAELSTRKLVKICFQLARCKKIFFSLTIAITGFHCTST